MNPQAHPAWPDAMPHQRDTVERQIRLTRAADYSEMGTGKTLPAIILDDLHHPSRPGPSLVVCPAIARWNWAREIERWSQRKDVHVITGGGDDLPRKPDWIISSYEMLTQRDLFQRLAVAPNCSGVLSWPSTVTVAEMR